MTPKETALVAVASLVTLSSLASLALVGCHPDASEPSPPPAASATATSTPAASSGPAASTAPPGEPVAPQTHHIVQKDHRSVVNLHVGDIITAPEDPAFAWRIELENKAAFTHVKDTDETYRVAKTGALRIMVFGDPKACMNTDAACTVSKRRWDVTLAVK